MAVLGCFALILFPVIGLAIGLYARGTPGAIWGAVIGFAIAAALSAFSFYALAKARKH
jgi:hypothetical protein